MTQLPTFRDDSWRYINLSQVISAQGVKCHIVDSLKYNPSPVAEWRDKTFEGLKWDNVNKVEDEASMSTLMQYTLRYIRAHKDDNGMQCSVKSLQLSANYRHQDHCNVNNVDYCLLQKLSSLARNAIIQDYLRFSRQMQKTQVIWNSEMCKLSKFKGNLNLVGIYINRIVWEELNTIS